MEVSIDAGALMPVVDAGTVVTVGEGTDAGSISWEGYQIDGGICVTIDLFGEKTWTAVRELV